MGRVAAIRDSFCNFAKLREMSDLKTGTYNDAVKGGARDFCSVLGPCSPSERMLDACGETRLASSPLSSATATSFFAASPVGWIGIVAADDANVSVPEKEDRLEEASTWFCG